jgi:hypothetical protein
VNLCLCKLLVLFVLTASIALLMYFINPLTHKLNKEDTMRGRSQSLNKTNQRRLEGFALIRCFDRLEQAHQHVGVRTTFLQSEYRSFE